MQLRVDGIIQDFILLKVFCETHALPATFGIAQFEPKDYSGLARIDTAGNDLKAVRNAVLKAIPDVMRLSELLPFLDALTQVFRTQLYAINDKVNLKDVEIEFAVAGFSDVCQAYLYDRIRAKNSKTDPQPFEGFYGAWLNDSVRVNQHTHTYTHHDHVWTIQIINHAYGRVGFTVHTGDSTYYIMDSALACPAQGYMFTLLKDVSHKLDVALAEDSQHLGTTDGDTR